MFTNNGFYLELNDDYMDVYLKLVVLLYADDTVIFFQIRRSVSFCFKYFYELLFPVETEY